MEQILNIVFHGLVIGILLSAPMGPSGMLCLQRTLNKGRWAGFFTGVGAALSDLIYCLLTGLGISFITDLIKGHQLAIQIIGSIVLIAIGLYLFLKKTIAIIKPAAVTDNKFYTDFATGFLLTFSNPLILFFIIGLFANFDFLNHGLRYYHYIIGYVSIFSGAILWWYLLTMFVNAVRLRFNIRYMRLVNRIIGVVLIVMAIAFLVYFKAET